MICQTNPTAPPSVPPSGARSTSSATRRPTSSMTRSAGSSRRPGRLAAAPRHGATVDGADPRRHRAARAVRRGSARRARRSAVRDPRRRPRHVRAAAAELRRACACSRSINPGRRGGSASGSPSSAGRPRCTRARRLRGGCLRGGSGLSPRASTPRSPPSSRRLGVSMYLTRDAIAAMLRQVSALAPGSTFVLTFLVPGELPTRRAGRARGGPARGPGLRHAVRQLLHAARPGRARARVRLPYRRAHRARDADGALLREPQRWPRGGQRRADHRRDHLAARPRPAHYVFQSYRGVRGGAESAESGRASSRPSR